jgi:putative membrane protein
MGLTIANAIGGNPLMSLLAEIADSGWFHHSSQWGWLMMIGFWLFIVVMVALLFKGFGGSRPADTATPSAKSILSARFARGEIDESEYEQRLAVLDRQ